MSLSLSLQEALRARLTASAPVTALVAPSAIVDAPGSAKALPRVQLGSIIEGAEDLTLALRERMLIADLHVFTEESGSVLAKQIAGAIADALRDWTPPLDGGTCYDFRFVSSRVLRDNDAPNIAHAVISFEARVELDEVTP